MDLEVREKVEVYPGNSKARPLLKPLQSRLNNRAELKLLSSTRQDSNAGAPHKLHMRHTGQTLHMAWVLLPDHTKRPALGCHSYRTSSTEADRPTPTFILSLSMQPHTYTWVHAVMTHRPMKVFPVFVSHFKEADGSYSGGDGKRSKIFKQKFF
uniref:Uncharacterized protein n=1 Tax=Knipowitschia caucasica TaxID=637954 RepID=A0AAV2L0L7_KNICA